MFSMISSVILTLTNLMIFISGAGLNIKCHVTKPGYCTIGYLPHDFPSSWIDIKVERPQTITGVTIKQMKCDQLPDEFFDQFDLLESLSIEKGELTTLDRFNQGSRLKNIYVTKTKLTAINSDDLSSSVEYLDLSRNWLSYIEEDAFTKLSKLTELDLSYNRIDDFDRNLIVPSIRTLNLEGNFLRRLETMFSRHPYLEILYLSSNRIGKVITNRTFAGLIRLEELDLSNNLLESIECGAFYTSKSLVVLKLSNNRLARFNFEITSNALKEIYIDGNMIQLMCITLAQSSRSPTKLELYAQNNQLNDIRFSNGIPIVLLALDNNDITDVQFLKKLNKLEQLSLSENDLSAAKKFGELLNFTQTIKRLNLENTNLSPIKFQEVLSLLSLTDILNVSNNQHLGGFYFSKPKYPLSLEPKYTSPVSKLYMNKCNFKEIDIKKLKNSFYNLKELEVSGNLFDCITLNDQLVEIQKANIRVQCGKKEYY